LGYIQEELERLKYQTIIPDSFAVFITAQVNAVGVLSATLDLVGEQLTYLNTFAAKLGPYPVYINSDFRTRSS
jgi:hypothetical protein